MHKNELADYLSLKTDIDNHAKALAMIDCVFGCVADVLTEGESVTITGFGTFDVKKTAARTGRNPGTGEAVEIPAKRVVRFKPGKGLKGMVN